MRCEPIATPTSDGRIRIERSGKILFDESRIELHRAWSRTSHAMQRLRDNPWLTPTAAAGDKVTSVSISYPRDLMRQRLAYSAMYEPSLLAAGRGTLPQPRRGSRR